MKKNFTYLKICILVILSITGTNCVWSIQNTKVINSANESFSSPKRVGDDVGLSNKAMSPDAITELTPDDIPGITNLSRDITLKGDWTAANIEALADIMNGDQTSVTLPEGTTIAADTDDWFEAFNENCLKIFGPSVEVPSTWTTNIVKLDADGNATSDNISLNGRFAFNTPVKITATEASFTREGLTSGSQSTLYLPFASAIPAGFTAYTFNKVVNNIAIFTQVTGSTLAANTPYLIIPNGTDINIYENNVEIIPESETTSSGDYEFLGTYTNISAVGFYGFQDNALKLGIQGATVPSFRAYLKPTTPSSSGAPARFSIDINSAATNVKDLSLEETKIYPVNGVIHILTNQPQVIKIYGIDGSLIQTSIVDKGDNTFRGLTKGMYIINNQKVINQ